MFLLCYFSCYLFFKEKTTYRTYESISNEENIQEHSRLLPLISRQILRALDHILKTNGLEKITVQRKVEGKSNRNRFPTQFIDNVKVIRYVIEIVEIPESL